MLLEMEVNEACSSCAAKSICGNTQTEKRVITVKRPEGEDISLGDSFSVSIKKQTSYRVIFLSYILPFLVFFITLVVLTALRVNELLSGIFSLGAVLLYFGILLIFKNKIEHKITFTTTKIK